jgi:hypothetical protein
VVLSWGGRGLVNSASVNVHRDRKTAFLIYIYASKYFGENI